MNELLEKFRFDGKRYWMKSRDGRWLTFPTDSINNAIAIELDVSTKEARKLRESVKSDSKDIDDPAWREEVAWLDFTKGRNLYLVGDKVEFCNRQSGNSTRSMKIADFNRVLQQRFPSKVQAPDEGGFGLLLP